MALPPTVSLWPGQPSVWLDVAPPDTVMAFIGKADTGALFRGPALPTWCWPTAPISLRCERGDAAGRGGTRDRRRDLRGPGNLRTLPLPRTG